MKNGNLMKRFYEIKLKIFFDITTLKTTKTQKTVAMTEISRDLSAEEHQFLLNDLG